MKKKLLSFCVLGILMFPVATAFGQTPVITITSVPKAPPGTRMASNPIKGTVMGADPKQYKVVVYAYGGTTWYVQPTVASPLIGFHRNGEWSSRTHGGLEFAALLVSKSYTPSATLSSIPPTGGSIVAEASRSP